MKTRFQWFAAAVLVAVPLAASAQFGLFGNKEATCNTKNCKIEVEAKEPNVFGCSIGDIKTKYGTEIDTLVITQPNTLITFELQDGFMFCPARGDGVFIVDDDPNFQFEADGFDDDKSIKAKGCKKRFRLIGANDNDKGKSFKYVIRFRSEKSPSKLCERDPWIRNT